MPKIRMKINLSGTTHVGAGKAYTDLRRGQVIEADEAVASQFCEHGYAEFRLEGNIGQPYKADAVPNFW